MGRFVQIIFVLVTIVVSVVVYALKYDTGRDAHAIAGIKRQITKERDAIKVLTAEWSLLNRPDRLQRLAEKYLELQPLRPMQLTALSDIELRPDSSRLETLVMNALAETAELDRAGLVAISLMAPIPQPKPLR